MAAKAIKLFDGVSYLLPVTTSELVQMHGTTQSLTTYINDIKNNSANTAKAKIQASDNTNSYYVYISPTGNYDVTNGNVFTIVKGSNVTLTPDATNNKLTIEATNTDTKVRQYVQSTADIAYSLLTRYRHTTISSNYEAQYACTTENASGTRFAYYNPARDVLYADYTYSKEFTENGVKLIDKYSHVTHTHQFLIDIMPDDFYSSFTSNANTVDVFAYFTDGSGNLAAGIDVPGPIWYRTTSVPTKKYVDDNFATKTELGNIQSGAEYTIVAANNSTTVNQALQGFSNAYLNLVNTTTNSVEKSIYVHGNNDGTLVGITGGSVIDVGISHNQDHTGTGSTGCLTYWNTNDEHTNVTSSYGANTTDAIQLHYIDSGVLKNVTVSSGSSSLPVYVDGGVIKPVTSTSLLKVYQQTSGTTNAKFPFLTKYTSGVSGNTSGDYSRITSNGTNDTLFAYVNPSIKVSYFQYAYAGEFTEGGIRLEDKYALKGTGGTDTNTAKVGWYYDDDNDDGEDVYAYIGPNGTQADTTNGVGSTIHFHASGGAFISYIDNMFTIYAPTQSSKVYQYSESNVKQKFPLLTKYASGTGTTPWDSGIANYVRMTGTSSNEAAYYYPGATPDTTSYLFIKNLRTSSILVNGQSITSGGGSSSLDYTVVNNNMDAITIF